MCTGFVSAASLNVSEVGQASSGVKNYTEVKSDIPGYVVVSGKNSSAPSFLNTITKWTLQLDSGVTTPVTISSVSGPTGASGSATGTLSKSEYLTVATNVKNFISSNGRAPNYASSSLGNIRYESLVYAYSKILDFYKTNDRLPNSVTIVNVAGVSGGVVISSPDYTPPTVTANPTGGTYTTTKTVTLTATDNKDPNPLIYYTIDGSTPTTSSTLYTNPININVSTVLKFMARDASGNQAAAKTMNYIINRVTDITTGRSYSTIQSAVNDVSTLNGDIIQVSSGTYTENILIKKGITLRPIPNNTVIIQALSISNPVITLNCNNSTIEGFTIKGATNSYGIFINTLNQAGTVEFGKNNFINGNTIINNKDGINSKYCENNTIQNNNIENNNQRGIYFFKCHDNIIQNNTILNNAESGIEFEYHSDNNEIQYNTITHNNTSDEGAGIDIHYSENTLIQYNTVVYNEIGVYIEAGTAVIHFNRIASNIHTGLQCMNGSTVDAMNNWWGKNSPVVKYGTGDLILLDSNVTYNPWLVLTASADRTDTNGEYDITADLTKNSNGNDTSPSGTIPNNAPIGFVTTLGTITTPTYTNKGKTTTTLNFTTHGEAIINVSLDSQNVNTNAIYGIYNQRTNTLYESIQEAINDSATTPGDTIILDNGTYSEDIIINKSIKIVTGNGSSPTLNGSININSNDTTIQGLIINGHINLFTNNCTIFGNTIIGNGTSGIIISSSTNNTITHNNITSNGFNGIQSIGCSVVIYHNSIHDCINAIYSENSNNTIISNTITNNSCGIYTNNSTDTIQFNRITGNLYGLKNEIGTVNATNNWWGKNNPIVSSSIPSDIYNINGTVNYNPYLILSVNVSSTNSGGNTRVTADITHNNQGLDTSSQGFIPDRTPVNFTTDNGTIVGTAYTIKGQAATILNLNSLQPQNVTVSASLDNQNVSTTGIVSTGSEVLNIISTAIDNSTGQKLNITYNIPLNEPVIWLSILWIPTTIPGISNPSEEIQIIINGNIVLNRYIYNINGQNSDDLIFNLTYPGVNGFNITIIDPNNQITNLNFPGNMINRTSKISYTDSPYEGVHSFAIATTKVTTDIFNYWLNQYSLYQSPGGVSDAYATFMTSLMVEYVHDLIAESLSSEFNVTWSRTSPIIVSTHQDLYEIYLTLDCDHIMGMTAVGTLSDLWIFNYFTSSSISMIENVVMNGVTNSSYQFKSANREFDSVVVDILKFYNLNNATVESFVQDNYLIIRTINNYDYLVIDLETGIVRDINTINSFCGSTATYEVQPIYGFDVVGTIHLGYPVNWLENNTLDFGTITFYWDSKGKIFLASSPFGYNPNDQIGAIGEIKVRGSFNTTASFNPGNPGDTWVSGPDLEVTQLFMPGLENTANVSLYSSGTRYGYSSLWLIQVITTPLDKSINTTNLDLFTKKTKEDSPWNRIKELGTGIGEAGIGWGTAMAGNYQHDPYLIEAGEIAWSDGWDRIIDALT